MRDIVRDAVDDTQDTTEREASGTVDGHDVRLAKEKYQATQRGAKKWRVAVYVDGPTIPSEQEKDMEPDEAESLFQRLKDKYSLA